MLQGVVCLHVQQSELVSLIDYIFCKQMRVEQRSHVSIRCAAQFIFAPANVSMKIQGNSQRNGIHFTSIHFIDTLLDFCILKLDDANAKDIITMIHNFIPRGRYKRVSQSSYSRPQY
jgi:hypothetical protein